MRLEPKFEVTDNKFYNLIVYKDNADEVVKQIVEFLPQAELSSYNQEDIYLFLQSATKNLVYDSRMAISPFCVALVWEQVCDCAGHTIGENCSCTSFHSVAHLEVVPCPPSGGAMIPSEDYPIPVPNIPTNPDGNTNAYGGSSDDNGIILVDPIVPHDANNPCDKIKNLTSKTTYRTNMRTLNNPSNFSLPYESGFVENIGGNGLLQYQWLYASGSMALQFPVGSKNFTHIHPIRIRYDGDNNQYDGAIKMFSPGDLESLLTKCQQANGSSPNDSFGVLISNEAHYAIKLNEATPITPEINSKWSKFVKDYTEEATKIIENTNLSTYQRNEKLQKMFLKFLNDLGLGNKISLFEGNITNTPSSVNITWTQKTLSNNGSIVSTPCI